MCVCIHTMRVRQNFTIEKRNLLLLQKVVKESSKFGRKETMSGIINKLIEKNLQDPIERLRQEAKELQIQIVSKLDRIKELEQLRENQNKN